MKQNLRTQEVSSTRTVTGSSCWVGFVLEATVPPLSPPLRELSREPSKSLLLEANAPTHATRWLPDYLSPAPNAGRSNSPPAPHPSTLSCAVAPRPSEGRRGVGWASGPEDLCCRKLTSKVRRGTTMVIQLSAIVMCVLRCSAITSMERRNRTDHTM